MPGRFSQAGRPAAGKGKEKSWHWDVFIFARL